jgi:hypothetical protein
LFPIAVNAIVSNNDFAWSPFANEIAILNPDDLDSPTAGVQHLIPRAQ